MRRSELTVLVGRVVRPPLRVRWRVRRMLAVPLPWSRSSQHRPRSSPLRSPVRRASSNNARRRWPWAAVSRVRASSAVRGSKRRGAGCAGADLAGDVARDLFLSDGVLQGGLEDGVDAVEGQRGESLVAARAGRAAAGLVAGGVEAAGAALAGGAELVEPCAHVFGGELGELLLPEAGDEVAVSAGGVAGVGVLAELAAGDVRQPVRQVGGDAALCGGYGTPRLLVAIFPVSLARASLRVMP